MADGVEIDVLELYGLTQSGMSAASTESLEAAAERLRGNFLEGLELSNFHDFHAWCVAERERVLAAQAAMLRELVQRAASEPRRALPLLRQLVSIEPYDEPARSSLVRLLMSLRHTDEAAQQYRLGMRMLKEIGAMSTGELFSAYRGDTSSVTPAISAVARSAATTAPDLRATPVGIIGRDKEVAATMESFARVCESGSAHAILLAGEPGIGKSRLLRQGGALVLSASAYESESLRPFGLWIDALKSGLPDAASTVFANERLDNRERLFEGLNDVLQEQLAERPVALVFDDVHWCDESSAAAMHYLVRASKAVHLFSLFSGRTADLLDNVSVQQSLRGLHHDGLLDDVELGPLSMQSVEQLVRNNAPGVDADAVAMVLEHAERQAMLVLTDGELRFSHDLVARAVYNQISPIRRQIMHRRVAELFEKSAMLDQRLAADLAHHATQSGDAGLAARAMASAGKLCLRFFANNEAKSLAQKGLQLAEKLSDTVKRAN